MCTGALKSTPVCISQHACNELPPRLRHWQLLLFYRAHLLTFNDHPTLSVIEDSSFDWFPDFPNYCSFNLLTKDFFQKALVLTNSTHHAILFGEPHHATSILRYVRHALKTLQQLCKVFCRLFVLIIMIIYIYIYTDGSKSECGTRSSLCLQV